ncbi:MAG TPA: hypothetical protein ENO30_01360 [Thermodesulfobium narugense]|nr:hypothetical protein [Thermodesulfobium narugense]
MAKQKQEEQSQRRYSMAEIYEAQQKVQLPLAEYILNVKRFPIIVFMFFVLKFSMGSEYALPIGFVLTYTIYNSVPLSVENKEGYLVLILAHQLRKAENFIIKLIDKAVTNYMTWY